MPSTVVVDGSLKLFNLLRQVFARLGLIMRLAIGSKVNLVANGRQGMISPVFRYVLSQVGAF